MPDESDNRRAAVRKVVLGHGLISGPNIHANCIIRDISSTGAKLGVSKKIKLHCSIRSLAGENPLQAPCPSQVASRRLRRSGVLPRECDR